MLGDDAAARRPQLKPQPGPEGTPPGGPVPSQTPTLPDLVNAAAPEAAAAPPPAAPGGPGPVPSHAPTMPGLANAVARAAAAAQAAPKTDPLIGMQLGEYVIQEQIGIGGMGIVYRGEQPLIGKQVAIKVLRPEVGDQSLYVERLLAEARAVNAIRHRGIIDIFSFDQMPDGRQYFVMEYLEGTPLDIWLANKGALSPQDAIRLADELLDALSAAHRAGVIHRDLKPSNIFLARQPTGGSYVKVLDFGLAKQISSGQAQQTLNGLIIGTPEYMAPEQVRGDPVSARTDLYSFGIILFQLLTGQLPFSARVPAEYLVHHLEHAPPDPLELKPELPPTLAKIVLRMLEKAPEARPTVDEVRTLLQDIADTLPLPSGARASREMRSLSLLDIPSVPPAPAREATPPPVAAPGPRATPPAKSRPLVVKVGVGAGALLLAASVAVVLWLRTPAPAPASAPAPAPVAAPVAVPTAVPVAETPVKPAVAEPLPEPAPQPAAPEPVAEDPAPAPASTRSSKGKTERKPPLLTRIERLERKLRASALPPDEKEGARKLLQKVRSRAESASTADERKQVKRNLDIWERQYLGN